MKIFFIRHGETEHNVAQLLAGVTDSRLTHHGILQTQRLGAHLAARNLRFTHIFSSDLQRAAMTAQAVAEAQSKRDATGPLEIIQLPQLREQDFGSSELVPYFSKRGQDSFFDRRPSVEDPGFVPKETLPRMQQRATEFLNDFILPLLATDGDDRNTVCITSHGLFLGVLWRNLHERFAPSSVTLGPDALGNKFGAAFDPVRDIGRWENTAYLEVDVSPLSVPNGMEGMLNAADQPKSSALIPRPISLPGHTMVIKATNSHQHTKGIKKTRLSNVAYDPKQRDIAGFFKKGAIESRSTPDDTEPETENNSMESGEALQSALAAELAVEGDSEAGEPSLNPMGRRNSLRNEDAVCLTSDAGEPSLNPMGGLPAKRRSGM